MERREGVPGWIHRDCSSRRNGNPDLWKDRTGQRPRKNKRCSVERVPSTFSPRFAVPVLSPDPIGLPTPTLASYSFPPSTIPNFCLAHSILHLRFFPVDSLFPSRIHRFSYPTRLLYPIHQISYYIFSTNSVAQNPPTFYGFIHNYFYLISIGDVENGDVEEV